MVSSEKCGVRRALLFLRGRGKELGPSETQFEKRQHTGWQDGKEQSNTFDGHNNFCRQIDTALCIAGKSTSRSQKVLSCETVDNGR